jgi:hypothetical protein
MEEEKIETVKRLIVLIFRQYEEKRTKLDIEFSDPSMIWKQIRLFYSLQ